MGLGHLGLLIRPFQPEDAPALLALHRRAIAASSDQFYTQEQTESWGAGLTPEGYLEALADEEVFEVAVVDGQVVAFCSRKKQSVVGLYVDPRHQRQGVGHALLERAEAALRRSGADRAEVRASLPAVRFYEHEGYTTLHDEIHQSRDGLPLPIVVMRKRLA